ncbi:hypothetical protein TURU_042249 [Turdus rufiventris]|nr:hypothetical protein TURU_042249 [Turdus rufiventris]
MMKYKVLHLGWDNLQSQDRLGDERTESSLDKKDLEVLVDERLDMTWQCALAVQKANCILGCTTRTAARRFRKGIQPLYSNVVKPHPECCSQLCGAQCRKDMDLLKQVQSRVTETISGLEQVSYEDRLFRLFIPEKRRF